MSTPLFASSLSRLPRIAGAAAQRARLTVVPRRSTHAARAPFVALVVLLLGVGVAGLLTFNTNMQTGAFTISTLQAQATSLQSEQQQLQMDLQVLRQPQHLADRARHLGMVPPPAPAFLMLATGKVLGDAMPAAATDAMRVNGPGPVKPPRLAPKPKIVKLIVPWGQPMPKLKKGTSGTRRGASATSGSGQGTTKTTGH